MLQKIGIGTLYVVGAVIGLVVLFVHPLVFVAVNLIYWGAIYLMVMSAQRDKAREAAQDRRHREIMAALSFPAP